MAIACWPKWTGPAASSECTLLIPNTAFPAFWEDRASTCASILMATRNRRSTCRWKTSSTESWKGFRDPWPTSPLVGSIATCRSRTGKAARSWWTAPMCDSMHIAYRTFPTAKGIVTFRYPPSERQRKAMAKVVKAWTSCGDLSLSPLGLDQSSKLAMRTSKFALKAGGSLNLGVPRGPAMIRALCMNLKPEHIQNADGARLQITWDGAKSPAVDLPLDYFFARRTSPSRSDRCWWETRRASGTTSCRCPIAVRARSRCERRSRLKARWRCWLARRRKPILPRNSATFTPSITKACRRKPESITRISIAKDAAASSASI